MIDMGIKFNADEIFEMAEQIERNGAKFYREAAEKTSDREMVNFLLDLAAMEEGHLQIFKQMRKQLTDKEKAQTVFDPDNQAALYLQSMADSNSYEGRISPTQQLTGNESIKEIFEIALNSEKESVVFYFGLRSFISEKAGKDNVENIITEELGHITILNQHLMALGRG